MSGAPGRVRSHARRWLTPKAAAFTALSGLTAFAGITLAGLAVLGTAPRAWAMAFGLPRSVAAQSLTPAQYKALNDKLSDELAFYLGAEDEKHADGKPYVDFDPRFEYMPSRGAGGEYVIHAKVGGAEYVPDRGEITKGVATGKLNYLLFTYALRHGQWVEIAKPQWHTQTLGRKAARRMTEAAERDEAAKKEWRARQAAAPAATPHP
jgi:hypothetical protein